MWKRFSFGFVLALVVAGCESSGVPPRAGVPPAQQPPAGLAAGRGGSVPLAKPGEGGAMAATSTTIVVARGDTVPSLADRHRVSIRDLIDANRLEPPYRLEPGRTLIIPYGRTHRVARGETLYGISRAYRSDMATLARLNNLQPPYGIYEGQSLRLPVAAAAAPMVTVAAVERAPATLQAPVTSEPLAPPAAAPPGQNPVSAAAGEPGTRPPSAVSTPVPPATVVSPAPDPPSASVARPEPPPSAGPGSRPPAPEAPTMAALPPARAGSLLFAWPARGRLISGFGPKPGGQHNDGINIEVARGAPVRAAEAGTVVYAGNELKGYGNLVLIRHAGGWVTAYAHNDELLVQRGAQVSKGQQIARAGSSGGVATPQVHFEVRKGRDPVDPLRYLGSPETISGAADRADRPGPG